MVEKFWLQLSPFWGSFTIAIFVFGVIGGMPFGHPRRQHATLAAILLPFTADLEPAGVALFAVIYCTGTHGGDHGHPVQHSRRAGNAPTAFDGYLMTRKGQSGKAVGAAVLLGHGGGFRPAAMAATEPLQWAIRNIGLPEFSRSSSLVWLWPRRLADGPSGKAGCRFFSGC